MQKEIIQTSGAPAAIGPYSQGIRAGNFVFVSGQIGLDPSTGALVEGSIGPQVDRTIRNVEAVLAAAGGGLANVVKVTMYLKSMDDFPAVNEVYARYFGVDRPARATVEVSRLPKDALFEMDAIAWVPSIP